MLEELPDGTLHDRGATWPERWTLVRSDHPHPLHYRLRETASACLRMTLPEALTVEYTQRADHKLWEWDGSRMYFDLKGALVPSEGCIRYKAVNGLPYTQAERAWIVADLRAAARRYDITGKGSYADALRRTVESLERA
ncbi:MAG: hypothetical protein EBS48_11440 [Actinobacteria bacterium]|nr:hypothetical protein [Actinomycetota bacterium]